MLLERSLERDDVAQSTRGAEADGLDQFVHQAPGPGPVGFAVGGVRALFDPPGGLDVQVLIGGDSRLSRRPGCL